VKEPNNYIFCRVTGFTSDFLSFIVVELIRFFHGGLQLLSAAFAMVVLFQSHKPIANKLNSIAFCCMLLILGHIEFCGNFLLWPQLKSILWVVWFKAVL